MPGGKHLRGLSEKEQRQYEHIKESAEKSGRYGTRASLRDDQHFSLEELLVPFSMLATVDRVWQLREHP